jgi:dolichol-phosphate mannosyltransferase
MLQDKAITRKSEGEMGDAIVSPRLVIVLPTYNEKENIRGVLDAIFSQEGRIAPASLSVLVVDDLSPDGTADIVREYSRKTANVHLLVGKKEGLGRAYKRGFAYTINNLNADIVFEMDADFSHNPDDIPRLLAKVCEGDDFVIGSRYVPGGSIPANWSLLRRAMSRWGNIFARHIAGLRDIKDCTSGFRAIKIEVIEKIDFDKLGGTGYAFLMMLLYEAARNGAKISEVPINFTDRVCGKSKLGLPDIAEFILKSVRIGLSFKSRPIRRAIARRERDISANDRFREQPVKKRLE